MKSPALYCLLLGLLTTNSAFAERRIVLMGGGGEPKDLNTTIFDQTLNSLDNYLAQNQWGQVVVSFNGGHSQTEALRDLKFANATSKSNFTVNNYKAIIKNYEDQIKNDELKSGDQLLIMIDTHGAMKIRGESTHEIAIGPGNSQTNLNDLGGETLISMDALKNLAELAKAKNIKLGILDFSCHSGNSLELANENTCVISSTGKNHFGFSDFSSDFIGNMKAGKSLENVFLDTRRDTVTNSFPMISTPQGEAINRDFYPDITPYLYYHEDNPSIDKMNDYLLQASTEVGLCIRENQFQELQKKLDSLQAASSFAINSNMPEISQIKYLIKLYKEKQDSYISLVRSWGINQLSQKEHFSATATVRKKTATMPGNFTWRELIETDFDSIITNVTNAKKSTKDAETQAEFQASIDMHTKAKYRQMEIMEQYPNLKDYKQKFRQQLSTMKDTYAVAKEIAKRERRIYDLMYANLTNENVQKNACKDFVL